MNLLSRRGLLRTAPIAASFGLIGPGFASCRIATPDILATMAIQR
ncbi:MAG TPA: hypothetical protein VL574_14065 [Stellaceae bacterium]|nr:hypothetical protein [Stellaceae bacterium]